MDCVGIDAVPPESLIPMGVTVASYYGRYRTNMKRLLAKYKTGNLRTCDSSQCLGSMRHINDELINGTHTYSRGKGREGRSNLRRNCKILIGVKGELRKEGATHTYIF